MPPIEEFLTTLNTLKRDNDGYEKLDGGRGNTLKRDKDARISYIRNWEYSVRAPYDGVSTTLCPERRYKMYDDFHVDPKARR